MCWDDQLELKGEKCRSIFDIDGIDLGPERRHYLEHKFERVWEVNCQGSIPYVPYLRAPYYVWLGQKAKGGVVTHEAKTEAPALFPPTFLYSQSWEDPAPDMKVLNINERDVCLTLTSGGCNSLNLVRSTFCSVNFNTHGGLQNSDNVQPVVKVLRQMCGGCIHSTQMKGMQALMTYLLCRYCTAPSR